MIVKAFDRIDALPAPVGSAFKLIIVAAALSAVAVALTFALSVVALPYLPEYDARAAEIRQSGGLVDRAVLAVHRRAGHTPLVFIIVWAITFSWQRAALIAVVIATLL